MTSIKTQKLSASTKLVAFLYIHISGGATISSAVISMKSFFSTVNPKKTSTFLYAFIITFLTFTFLLVFNSFSRGYTSSIFSFSVTKSISSADFFYPFSSNDSNFTINVTLQAPAPEKLTPVAKNATFESPITNLTSLVAKSNSSQSLISDKPSTRLKHQSQSQTKHTVSDPDVKARNLDKDRAFKINQIEIPASKASGSENLPGDSTYSPLESQEIESLKNCELYEGEWVKDDSYPLYKPGSCNVIGEPFNCFANGRPDSDFQKWKWKPNNCTLPRLNGTKFLEMIRGRRLVFVGDSLNRNMWESLVCILKGSVKDESQVFEVNERHQFRQEAEFSFVFKEYECTIEYYSSPFLVQEWETEDKKGTKKKTLRLDLMGKSSAKYKEADIIIFNTGHWWYPGKTSKGRNFYQVGSYVYPKLHTNAAFLIALKTWGQWIDKNMNPKRSLVFYRSFSSTHYRGGQWNSGGTCHNEIEPIKNQTYLKTYPYTMEIVETVLKAMKTPIMYLNITRLTDYRKDGHPSIYGKQKISVENNKSSLFSHQDCGHWCLPGVPDSWNEILYAELLQRLPHKSHQPHNKKLIVDNKSSFSLGENIEL